MRLTLYSFSLSTITGGVGSWLCPGNGPSDTLHRQDIRCTRCMLRSFGSCNWYAYGLIISIISYGPIRFQSSFLLGLCVMIFFASMHTLSPTFISVPSRWCLFACSTWISCDRSISIVICSKISFIFWDKELACTSLMSLPFCTGCCLKLILGWKPSVPKNGEQPINSDMWLFLVSSAIGSHWVQLLCW